MTFVFLYDTIRSEVCMKRIVVVLACLSILVAGAYLFVCVDQWEQRWEQKNPRYYDDIPERYRDLHGGPGGFMLLVSICLGVGLGVAISVTVHALERSIPGKGWINKG